MPKYQFNSNSVSRDPVIVEAPTEIAARSIAMSKIWGNECPNVPPNDFSHSGCGLILDTTVDLN